MASESELQHLYQQLIRVLGRPAATTLMELLRPYDQRWRAGSPSQPSI